MPLDLSPDKARINPMTGLSEKIESFPYIRYVGLGRPTIYLQAGVYYYESGEVVPDEKVTEYGLTPTFENGVPEKMSVPAEVAAILEAQKTEGIEEQARRLVGVETRRI